jgi:hypothetical protein
MKNALSLLSAFTLRRRFWAEAPQTQAPQTVTPSGFGPSTQSASLDTLSPGQRVSKPWADEVAATNMAFNCVKVLNHGHSEGKELVVSGCQVRVSQLMRRLPAGCRQITVYADTLVVDTPWFRCRSFGGWYAGWIRACWKPHALTCSIVAPTPGFCPLDWGSHRRALAGGAASGRGFADGFTGP